MPKVDVTTKPAQGRLTKPGSTTLLRATKVQNIQSMQFLFTAQLIAAAPVFREAPVQVGRGYAATNGQTYFVPAAVLGRRLRDSPDVFIDRETGPQGEKYVLRANFDVRRPDGLPPAALPLPIDGFTVVLNSPQARRSVNMECRVLPGPADTPGVVQRLQVQANVSLADTLFTLQQDPQAWFEIRANAHYRLLKQTGGGQGTGGVRPGGTGRITPVVIRTGGTVIRDHRTGGTVVRDHRTKGPQRTNPDRSIPLRGLLQRPGLFRSVPVSEEGPVEPTPPLAAPSGFSTAFNLKLLRGFKVPPVQPPPVDTGQAEEKTTAVVLSQPASAPAYFPVSVPALRQQNAAVYAEVSPELSASLDVRWLPSSHGYFRDSAVPNQFYVLPDRFGLAFDADQGLPDLTALLVPSADAAATGSQAYNVRVRFVLLPELDEERMEALRQYIRDQEGIPYPQFVIGGYKKATFASAQILEGMGATQVGAGELEVDASRGFELIMDCTLGLYNTLAGILISNPGLVESSVKFTIDTESGEFRYDVPVTLKLTDPANSPLTVDIVPGPPGEGPRAISIRNATQTQVSVDRIRPVLLFIDDGMPYPIDAVRAVPQPATVALQPGETANVSLSPEPSEQIEWDPSKAAPWGAVAVGLEGVRIALEPAVVMDRVHQMASSVDIKTAVKVWSFLLKNKELLPPTVAGLYGINVEMKKGSEAPIRVTLTLDNPEAIVNVAFSLRDILAGANPEQPTTQLRSQNLLATGTGPWSDWQEVTGREFHITPVGL